MLPSLFISHGSPMLALNKTSAHTFLRELGSQLSPKAVVVVSAHWESSELQVSSSAKPKTIHDFGGFPQALFDLQYAAPGDPELAERLAVLLGAKPVERGFDHGVWVPLSLMFPDANVPVVSLSLPVRWSSAQLAALGEQLSVLRDEGIFNPYWSRWALAVTPPSYTTVWNMAYWRWTFTNSLNRSVRQ